MAVIDLRFEGLSMSGATGGIGARDGGDTLHVNELRKEVASLKNDVQHIRSNMQEMHQEVGLAVLLLSRFIGVHWNSGEATRLAEEHTANANDAVDRLASNVGILEQRINFAETVSSRSKDANTTPGRRKQDTLQTGEKGGGVAESEDVIDVEDGDRHRERDDRTKGSPSSPPSRHPLADDCAGNEAIINRGSAGVSVEQSKTASAGHGENPSSRPFISEDLTASADSASDHSSAPESRQGKLRQSDKPGGGSSIEANEYITSSGSSLNQKTLTVEQDSTKQGTEREASSDKPIGQNDTATGGLNLGDRIHGGDAPVSPRQPTVYDSNGSGSRSEGDSRGSWKSWSED